MLRTVAFTREPDVAGRLRTALDPEDYELLEVTETLGDLVATLDETRADCVVIDAANPAEALSLAEGASAGRPLSVVAVVDPDTVGQAANSDRLCTMSRRLLLREDRPAQKNVQERLRSFAGRQYSIRRRTHNLFVLEQELESLRADPE